MSARPSSRSNGAQVKLLKMVNDQRARCKLTTLDNVMDHTGYSWVESMIEHARDLFNDHSSSALSEMDMNVNILRSPKKDRAKRTKKIAPSKKSSPKKASPYKKSQLPKESTPPHLLPKKTLQLSSAAPSPRSSTSTKVADRESVASYIKATNLQASEKVARDQIVVEIDLRTPEGKDTKTVKVVEDLSQQLEPAQIPGKSSNLTRVPATGSERKRKSQDGDAEELPTKRQSPRRSSDLPADRSRAEVAAEVGKVIDDTFDEAAAIPGGFVEEAAAPVPKPAENLSPFKSENYSIIAETTEELSDDVEAEDEEEVSRVMGKEVEGDKASLSSPAKPNAIGDVTRENAGGQSNTVLATPVTAPRASMTESVDSNGTRSTRNDDVFSDAEPEVAPSNTASKPTLRERIDRLRSMFSPAARPTSSIPRLSPPKLMQSPPRPIFSRGDSISSKASSKSTSPSTKSASPSLKTGSFSRPPSPSKSPSKSPFMSPPKAPAIKAPVKAPALVSIPSQSIKIASTSAKVTSKPIQTIKVSGPVQTAQVPIPPIRFASISASSTVSNASAPAAVLAAPVAPIVAPVVSAPKVSATIASIPAPAPLTVKAAKAAPPPKPAVVAAAAAPPPKASAAPPLPAISMANPFQKAQQQQQQQALATTSTLRVKQGPPPNTAHIELEEPDSAYSDSEDEETVRRRQQHKPWETREGLAKALEEQAHIDADMIFGIPHGAVPIDEILPAETEYARAKRARPRSSSATWSRDGLKQIEIDRYNERMGIQGPGVLLPLTVQDDGSGTPSRAHRLSAIAQSAISQGGFSRKPSQSHAGRGTLSPTRPSAVTSSIIRNGGTASQLLNGSNLTQSNVKYPSLQTGTPTRSKPSMNGNVPASTQKSKVVKPAASNASLQSSKATSKNVYQGAFQSVKASATSTKKKI